MWRITLCFFCLAAKAANPVQTENSKAGSGSWHLSNPATNHEIEGYASRTSVNRGEQISFFVNTASPSFTLEVFRMGWYGGAGGRSVHGPITRAGIVQPIPSPAPGTHLVDCNWSNPYVLNVPNNAADPTDWASGVYLVKLTAANGKQSYIIFVVRDDARPSPYLFQCSVTTYQAYNNWGGYSLYGINSIGFDHARKVSFNRPYAPSPRPNSTFGAGAGDFFCFLLPASYQATSAGWEYNMLRFLEREGYDVTYCTDLDTHANGNLLLPHKWFLSVGHDEYWSWQMRTNVVAARDRGVNLGFFGANICVWQIRFEPSAMTGAADRTMVCYKEAIATDPFATDGNLANDHLISGLWRTNALLPPEGSFIGVMYESDPVNGDMIIEDASSWVCAGTGLVNGSRLPGLLGYEVDRMWGIEPPGTVRIAHSPYTFGGQTRFSDMTTYTASSGATVFATGTLQWTWGLDDFNAPNLRPSRLNAAVQQMTRNVLARGVQNQSGLPGAASNPGPAHTSTGVSLDVTLSWTAGPGATSHRIFLGTSPTLGSADLRATQSASSYPPGMLSGLTSYYWRIDEVNDRGTTPGPAWSFTTAAACPCVIPLAWWAAEGAANDSADGNTGSLQNGATVAPGQVGQAFNLDGVDDYVAIPDSTSLRPVNLTVEGWFNFTETNSVRVLVSKAVGAGVANSWALWTENGVLRAQVGDDSGGGTILNHPTFRPVPGQWYHIAYTFDDAADLQALSVNGVVGASGGQTQTIGYDGHGVILGADFDSGAHAGFFRGRLDEVSIYDRVLSAAEIEAIFNSGSRGKDRTPPVLACPANVQVRCNTSIAPAVTGSPTATDNCGAVSALSHSDREVPGNCPNTKIITRTWTAIDCAGNAATCQQMITVADTTQPTIICAAGVVVGCGASTAPAFTGFPTAFDSCDLIPALSYSDSEAAGNCPSSRIITRTWRATDCAGNTATCRQTITMRDTAGPAIACPANIVAEPDPGLCTAVVGYAATVSDDCDANPTLVCVPPSGFAFPMGATTVVCTGRDLCANTNTCSFMVTVEPSDPLSVMSIRRQGSSVVICWPAGCHALESKTDLNPIVPWGTVTVTPTSDGGKHCVALPVGNGTTFFRLRQQ